MDIAVLPLILRTRNMGIAMLSIERRNAHQQTFQSLGKCRSATYLVPLRLP
ncbi:hypothetical protein TorRG33x02_340300, partial [Trema orientale]